MIAKSKPLAITMDGFTWEPTTACRHNRRTERSEALTLTDINNHYHLLVVTSFFSNFYVDAIEKTHSNRRFDKFVAERK